MEMNRPQCGRDAIVTRTFGGFNAVADCPRTRTGYGHGLCAAADWTRTRIVRGHGLVADDLRPGHGHGRWTGCGRGCGHGQDTVTDWTRPRSWRGCGLVSDWTRSRTGHGHGRLAGLLRGHSASKPRPLRGLKNLPPGRSKACPVLNMMRNTLPPLLQQFVTPGFQLRGDSFDACSLFNRPGFNVARLLVVKL